MSYEHFINTHKVGNFLTKIDQMNVNKFAKNCGFFCMEKEIFKKLNFYAWFVLSK